MGVRRGLVVFALVALATGPMASTADAATFSVTTSADAGPGSLRAAVVHANATGAADTITFAITPSGSHVISLSTPLPAIVHPVVIDGASQPGFAGSPLIQLDNGTGSPSAVGLDVAAGGSTVSGLSVTGFGIGIRLRAGDGNIVSGSWLGLDTSGAGAGNAVGLRIVQSSAANRIGGITAAARNVISGNTTAGVEMSGKGTSGNLIRGNRIGTNPAGNSAMSDGVGIMIHGGANGNTVGGTTSGARNLVSGNLGTGISLFGSGTKNNLVEGNRIGTDAAGTAALPNSTGLRIEVGATENTVGGTTAGARNLISGNDIGLSISGAGATGNAVAGNFIGTDASGSAALGNIVGLSVSDGATGNTIGGTTAGARNVISANPQYGVWITSAGTSGNRIQGNRIGTNAAGTAALGNTDGVHIDGGASGNFVGGATTGAGNLISGNGEDGVDLADSGTTGNRIRGNRIGTTADGTAALKNSTGVRVEAGAGGNTIGGTTAAARNVIGGNDFIGICLCESGPGNTVSGNYIGTNASGTAGLPSSPFSPALVFVLRSPNNTIGGAAPGAGNVIAGSQNGAGVSLDGSSSNVVVGNRIGTNAAGTAAIGNSVGVSMSSGGASPPSSDNVVGGTTAGSGNLISGNGYGLYLQNPQTTGNTIAGNSIGTNAAGSGGIPNDLGINIEASAEQNTVGGTAAGAGNVIAFNTKQGVILGFNRPVGGAAIERNSIFRNGGLGIERFGGGGPPSPVVTSIRTRTVTTVKGMLDSAASTSFRIELFASPGCDPSGHGEGKSFLGAVNVVTDGAGHASFTKSLGASVPPGRSVTATATTGFNTSEFSACVGSP